jgi:hypothetical protein
MGFDFLDQTPRQVVVDVTAMLEAMRARIEAFAQWEDLARYVVDTAKGPPEAWRAIDRNRLSDMSSELWQKRNWWFDLAKIVPFLNLELMKHAPKNLAALEKSQKFWERPFRWNHKGDPVEGSRKYPSVLAELRKQLAAIQEAAARVSTSGVEPEIVGKFELYDALGDQQTKNSVATTLQKVTRAMTTLGLGAYCYGKVTIVNSTKLHGHSSAFYVKNTDELYVGDMKGQDVRAVCHEIGHRIHTKLNLRSKTKSLYETVQERGIWVSNYAKTDDEENFCEMLSFAAIKDLPDESKDLLKTVVPKIKLATAASVVARSSQILAVAYRYMHEVNCMHD